jgi:protein tyrosine phosphatase (PTP) superfamily phosphohydrolase (DUF442 family)
VIERRHRPTILVFLPAGDFERRPITNHLSPQELLAMSVNVEKHGMPKLRRSSALESTGISRIDAVLIDEAHRGFAPYPPSFANRTLPKIPKLAAVLLLTFAVTLSHAHPPASRGVHPHGLPPIENLHQLAPTLLSGGQPKDDAAFSKLAEMGVKTIISVDGARPDLAAAKKHGLRYIHIPIGYDGVEAEAQAALTRVVREVKGPVFIHCHHGKHRGPAAAAVACMAAGAMTPAEATAFLKLAGTGKEYAGLWRDVAHFKPLAADAKLLELVEVAEVDSLAAAMAQLDRAWDGAKLCQAAGWQTPKDHADLAPVHQALLVLEGFKESRRNLDYDDAQLAAWVDEATAQAEQLHQSLKANHPDEASRAYKQLEAACLRCHEQYRN